MPNTNIPKKEKDTVVKMHNNNWKKHFNGMFFIMKFNSF